MAKNNLEQVAANIDKDVSGGTILNDLKTQLLKTNSENVTDNVIKFILKYSPEISFKDNAIQRTIINRILIHTLLVTEGKNNSNEILVCSLVHPNDVWIIGVAEIAIKKLIKNGVFDNAI